MENKEIFEILFKQRKLSDIYKESLCEIFTGVIEELTKKVEIADIADFAINPSIIFNYVVEETAYNLQLIKKEDHVPFISSPSYIVSETRIISDKIFLNELLGSEHPTLVSRFSPLVTTFDFMANYILNTFNRLNKKGTQERALLLDIMKKGFVMSKTIISLLVQGANTEAFSTWRTLHEVECIAKILYENPYLTSTYIRHMEYAQYYRNEEADSSIVEAKINEVHELMKPYNLKSKDTKKYIEYGWLYSYKDVLEKFPEFRPNFRKGIELVSGLSSYSKIYEMSSELAHSSPMLIYSNPDYFKSLTLLCLYDTFFRLENIFNNIMMNESEIDYLSYAKVRENALMEMNKNIQIERVQFNQKYKRKYPSKPQSEEEKDSE
jgi:hypothetical protein